MARTCYSSDDCEFIGVTVQSELTLLEQIKSGKIWDFPGGIHPPEQKSLSNQGDISIFNANRVFVPISQHIGQVGEVIVKVGDQVLKGQPLTQALDGFSLPVHAPVSGVIKNIGLHVSAHASGIESQTIEIESDQLEASVPPSPITNWRDSDPQTLVNTLKTQGVAGLGGASFPTYVKMTPSKPIDLLIINAVECEPYITADDVLMRYHSEAITTGIQILQHLVNAKMVLIGIEDNKPEAVAAMTKATAEFDQIEVRVVPTKYPSGGEKQLIQLLTNQEVPTGGIPADIGIVMQNVGTCFAAKEAIVDGLPLTKRVVTLTGENVGSAQNMWVPLGTPVRDVLEHVGFTPQKRQKLIMGGPMMGFNIMNDLMPVVKSTNCILAPSSSELPERGMEQACIRCGLCADACPAELLPQQLQWFAKAKDHEKLEEYNLFDCIECGACSYVCPSQIPLVQYYRVGKAEIREEREEKIKSDKAKKRFEERQARLEREKEERLQRHKEAAEKRKKALDKDDSAKDKIAAALARAKAKKQETPEEAPKDEPQDKVAAAIARAKAKKATKEQENTPASESGVDAQKEKVAAAIARAKAKKAAQSETQSEPEVTSQPAQDDQKAKVAAAIARAKAKKAAQSETQNESKVESQPAQDEQKAKVAAAIARAKAKKAAQSDTQSEPEVEAQSSEDEQKAKVAAAIARAKAKKEAKAQQDATEDAAQTVNESSSQEGELTEDQQRKAKVAAAIAKAKAKKQAQEQDSNVQAESDEPEANEPKSAEALRKEKVAAAIAKAKAKKQAAEQAGKDKE